MEIFRSGFGAQSDPVCHSRSFYLPLRIKVHSISLAVCARFLCTPPLYIAVSLLSHWELAHKLVLGQSCPGWNEEDLPPARARHGQRRPGPQSVTHARSPTSEACATASWTRRATVPSQSKGTPWQSPCSGPDQQQQKTLLLDFVLKGTLAVLTSERKPQRGAARRLISSSANKKAARWMSFRPSCRVDGNT